jgi:hypothetical protein
VELGVTLADRAIRRAAIVQVGLTRNAKHEYWLDGRGPIPSVTTILKVVDKSGPLVGWAKRITAEAAVDNRAAIEGWVGIGGRDGAVQFLTKAATAQRDRAANAGTEVHSLAEAIVRGQPVVVVPELAPFLAAYQGFLDAFEPEFLAAEEMVCNESEGYAGTLDSIAVIAGETWMLDIKTGKGVFPETAMQLAAYANAEFIGRPGDPTRYAIPPVEQYGVVHLRPEGYELVPYSVTNATFRAFLAARDLHQWQSGEGSKVIGQPIGPALRRFPETEGIA